MGEVVLEKTDENLRFIIMNKLLDKEEVFSREEIEFELKLNRVESSYILDDCLKDLIDNGLLYEIGSKYRNYKGRRRLI